VMSVLTLNSKRDDGKKQQRQRRRKATRGRFRPLVQGHARDRSARKALFCRQARLAPNCRNAASPLGSPRGPLRLPLTVFTSRYAQIRTCWRFEVSRLDPGRELRRWANNALEMAVAPRAPRARTPLMLQTIRLSAIVQLAGSACLPAFHKSWFLIMCTFRPRFLARFCRPVA